MVLLSTTMILLLSTLLLVAFPDTVNASLSVPTTMVTTAKAKKPECQRKCGKLTIPYPFGIDKDCAMGDEYIITCNEDNKVYIPQFLDTDLQVLEISETQVTIAAGEPLAESCKSSEKGNTWGSLDLSYINECASDPCDGTCENTEGGYKCHCPSGFYRDGRIDGLGCRPRSLRLVFILGNCVGLGFILFLIGGYMAYRIAIRRKEIKKKATNFKRNGGLLLKQKMSSEERLAEQTRLFTSKELEKATDQFNADRVLGRGGQGIVYKGMLSDGNLVAIKKHKIGSNSPLEDFINEIAILSELNHRNIVKLIGCCLETDVPLLVYEFVPNGTLSKFIHDPQEEFPITWGMRLQIALDVAGALTYLHYASSKPILHKDVKSSNILLDAKYRAKLSDFGTSRSIAIDQTHLTTRVQGTFGYLDPEYFQSSKYTEKSDVYSFGVVLVELLTGKKAVVQTESDNGRSLVSWFLSSMENSDLYDILADRVVNEASKETILAIAKLAKQSLNMDGRQRPTMRQVSLELEAISHHQGASISFLKSMSMAREQILMEGTDIIDGGVNPRSL
ncbi:wall-associated receptor kinase-like 1 [Silene latifolia]|uniref:wall-associated receptor kinase-like 1 n=1 Tax=Silene latifolia TaxID=37657 RepID=UPI003D77DE5C